MTLQKRRLGRGLESLISEAVDVDAATGLEGLRNVALEALKPGPFNPRNKFDPEELQQLAESIKTRGLVQPIIVRPANEPGGGYEIIAGERRWRAAQLAALHDVPVIVRDISDSQALELAIIENVQRTDLNAIEEAAGYRQLMDTHGYTQEDVAGIVGKSRSHLANTLRLLTLPPSVLEFLRQGALSAGHARPLVGREDAGQLALEIVKRGLSVRDVEALIQKRAHRNDATAARDSSGDADIHAAERELSDVLGLKVKIIAGKGEKGALRIAYSTLEQFEDVRRRLLKRD